MSPPYRLRVGSWRETVPHAAASLTSDVAICARPSATFGKSADAEGAFIVGMDAGKAHFNLHSTDKPGDEIRGLMRVPEPTGLALVALSFAVLCLTARRRSR